MFVPLPVSEDNRAAPLRNHQVGQLKADEIPDPTPGEQQQIENGGRAGVLAKLDFTDKFPYLTSVETLWCQSLPLQFLHSLCRVGWNMTLISEPAEKFPHGDDGSVRAASGQRGPSETAIRGRWRRAPPAVDSQLLA